MASAKQGYPIVSRMLGRVASASNASDADFIASLHRELRAIRNFKPAFKRGLYFAMFNAGIEAETGIVTLKPATAGRVIDLGTNDNTANAQEEAQKYINSPYERQRASN